MLFYFRRYFDPNMYIHFGVVENNETTLYANKKKFRMKKGALESFSVVFLLTFMCMFKTLSQHRNGID